MRQSKRRKRDGVERASIDCTLGKRHCVWPQCTCPPRDVVETVAESPPPRQGVTSYRRPIGPVLPRKRRPPGWSPLSDWVLVRTKTGSENWAALNCKQQAIETWNPRVMVPGRGTPQPLFPGYLFVLPGDKWRKLSNTYGVLDIVMMGGAPAHVPKAVIKSLRKMADKDGIVTLPRQRKPEKGEPVEIKFGAWQGFEGLYDGLSPQGRIRVLLKFMGKEVVLFFNRQSSVQVVNA